MPRSVGLMLRTDSSVNGRGGDRMESISPRLSRFAAWMARASARFLRLRRSAGGKITAEAVGFGLAAGGAILAISALVGLIFVPASVFPLIDAEVAAFMGVILLVAGIIVHAAD